MNRFFKLNLNLRSSSQLITSIENVWKRSFSVESDMALIKTICLTLSCTEDTALNLYKQFPSSPTRQSIDLIKPNIDLLKQNGISNELIASNHFLLFLNIGVLKRKLQAIKQMEPDYIDDFIPLLTMKEPTLKKVAAMAVAERNIIPEKSRIYYLSKKLQIEPATVSTYCSKNEFIFFTSFNGIAKKLNTLQDYNVDSKQILQSLYVFQCAEQVLISRIEELLSNGLTNIKLWFFKCTDEQFQKVLSNEIQNKNSHQLRNVHISKKTNLEKLIIMNILNEMLHCEDKLSAQIYYSFINTFEKLELAETNIKFLIGEKVSLECIKDNTVVLTLPSDHIEDNIAIIKEMKPDSLDDFLPLIEVKTADLNHFRNRMKGRLSKLPKIHTIYYFSKKLNIPPSIVSKHFAKHSDVFLRDFDELKRKLDLLVAYNVQPLSILKSSHTFNMSFESLEITLNKLKCEGIGNISSWMLVCDESRMERVAARRVAEKKSLGESTNIIDYLSKRLDWDDVAKEKAIKCYPPLVQCSILKVKGHLDYLLEETHFTKQDISSNASVFRTNLDELKLRLNELYAIGLVPRKLYSICLSRESYLKMVERYCEKKQCPVASEAFMSIKKRIKKI